MGKLGHTTLITGASAGIGRELARLAAHDKRDLVLVARRRERLEELAAELRAAHGVEVTVLPVDLARPTTPKAIFEQVQGSGLALEALINNAGFGTFGPFVEADGARQLEMIDVNVRALVELTHLFLPGMLARKQGQVLNIASVAGFVPGPYMATYYASKAFVLSFTEALATELRGTGVTATASCPGPTASEFGDVAGDARSKLLRRTASAEKVAKHAYRAMLSGDVVAIPGWKNELLAQSVRLSPRALVRSAAASINVPRK
jgi:short-subunit dehydrogenase